MLFYFQTIQTIVLKRRKRRRRKQLQTTQTTKKKTIRKQKKTRFQFKMKEIEVIRLQNALCEIIMNFGDEIINRKM